MSKLYGFGTIIYYFSIMPNVFKVCNQSIGLLNSPIIMCSVKCKNSYFHNRTISRNTFLQNSRVLFMMPPFPYFLTT